MASASISNASADGTTTDPAVTPFDDVASVSIDSLAFETSKAEPPVYELDTSSAPEWPGFADEASWVDQSPPATSALQDTSTYPTLRSETLDSGSFGEVDDPSLRATPVIGVLAQSDIAGDSQPVHDASADEPQDTLHGAWTTDEWHTPVSSPAVSGEMAALDEIPEPQAAAGDWSSDMTATGMNETASLYEPEPEIDAEPQSEPTGSIWRDKAFARDDDDSDIAAPESTASSPADIVYARDGVDAWLESGAIAPQHGEGASASAGAGAGARIADALDRVSADLRAGRLHVPGSATAATSDAAAVAAALHALLSRTT